MFFIVIKSLPGIFENNKSFSWIDNIFTCLSALLSYIHLETFLCLYKHRQMYVSVYRHTHTYPLLFMFWDFSICISIIYINIHINYLTLFNGYIQFYWMDKCTKIYFTIFDNEQLNFSKKFFITNNYTMNIVVYVVFHICMSINNRINSYKFILWVKVYVYFQFC